MSLRFGEFEVFPDTYGLQRAGESVHVQPRVFEVLVYLLAHRDRVVHKAELLEKVWPNEFVSESALSRVVRDARRALGDTGAKVRWIQTVHGRGFRFAGEVVNGNLAAADAGGGFGGVAGGVQASVAVLPFLDLGPDKDNELFANGITEDVIAQLAKIRSLKVISRSSVIVLTQRDRSPREIGALLGAGTLLEGSVRRAGRRVRIVAKLVDSATGHDLWVETYDRELTDIFAIQTDVALHIAAALRAELSPDERQRIARPPTHNLHAYELYLQGRHSLGRYTAEGLRNAIGCFEQAVAEDPGFALAHVGLARVYAELANEGFESLTPESALALAKESVARALAIDDGLGEAHGIVALLKFCCDFDWTGAEQEFERALELSPGSADIYDHYGWMCQSLERNDDAIRLLTRARELDPLAHPTDLAAALLRAGRHQEALAMGARIVEFDPGLARGHSVMGWAYLLDGQSKEGLAALERAAAISPEGTLFLGQLGQAYAMAGQRGKARRVLRRLTELARVRYVSPYHLAYVHTGLGEDEAAIDWLERAYEQRAQAIYGIKGSFLFASLRSHPRFIALLRKMNLA